MPSATFSYNRTQPTAVPGDTGNVPSALTPALAPVESRLSPIEISFAPQPGADPYDLFFPDVVAMRDNNGNMAGFTTPGDRDSGGIGEVRIYAPLAGGGFSSTGQLVPCKVDYAPFYDPGALAENPGGTIRLHIRPVTPYRAGSALFRPGYLVRLDLSLSLPTTSINYL